MIKYRIIVGTGCDGYLYEDNLSKAEAEELKKQLNKKTSTPSYIEKYEVKE